MTLHFHPDLLFAGGSTLEAIVDRGAYLSQFETQTGNGGLTAHPGGDRWKWESRMFGGTYGEHEPAERPDMEPILSRGQGEAAPMTVVADAASF